MFVDKPIGDPLKRKQLKWLLAALGAVMVVAVLVYVSTQNRVMDRDAQVPIKPEGKVIDTSVKNPTPEDVQRQLDMLAEEDANDLAPKPTQEDIEKQLEALSKE